MKRPRQKRRGALGQETEQLVRLATGLAQSGSRTEDRYWEQHLTATIDRVLGNNDEDALNAALDHLYGVDARAYEELADFIESRAENSMDARKEREILLVAAPILAWSRYNIPANTVPAAARANLRVHLQAHVFAEGARIALADFLFSPDQLPQGYCATAAFMTALGHAAIEGRDLHIDTSGMPETTRFLSDTRYLLAAVSVARGDPIFSWQEQGGGREQALTQWRNQGGACLAPLLPGCATEVVLPDAYFAANREADRSSRPYSVRASVALLGAELEVPAAKIRAIIAPFHDSQLEEYRIGFAINGNEEVVHGVVWPLLGAEDESTDVVAEIEAVLRDSGVSDIVNLEHRFPLEYCDDCGAPLYPAADGEIVHADMPEAHNEQVPRHLH
jgi:hypothetical protein